MPRWTKVFPSDVNERRQENYNYEYRKHALLYSSPFTTRFHVTVQNRFHPLNVKNTSFAYTWQSSRGGYGSGDPSNFDIVIAYLKNSSITQCRSSNVIKLFLGPYCFSVPADPIRLFR